MDFNVDGRKATVEEVYSDEQEQWESPIILDVIARDYQSIDWSDSWARYIIKHEDNEEVMLCRYANLKRYSRWSPRHSMLAMWMPTWPFMNQKRTSF
jgi:hypothetical protein